MLPVAVRRAYRPVKLQLVGLLVAGVFLYGGIKTGKLWGGAAVTGNSADQPAWRRLDGDTERTLKSGTNADLGKTPGPGLAPKTDKPSNLTAALYACMLFYMFLALAIVCDEFFVPALDVITEKLNLSPDVAGATFMAAGGSAPEFFTSLVGAFSDPPSDVGIATIVGSAVFNVLFVIGACGIAAKDKLELTAYPLARDSAFYVVNLLALCLWFYDGKIEWYEAAIQFSMYLVYCIFMVYSENVQNWFNERTQDRADKSFFNSIDKDGDGLISKEEAQAAPELLANFDKFDTDHDGKLNISEVKAQLRGRRAMRQQSQINIGQEPEPDEPVSLAPPKNGGCKEYLYWIASAPIVLVLMLTVPDVRRSSNGESPSCWRNWYPVTFALSIVWVAIFSKVMVDCSVVVGDWTEIDQRILALTLIASGTSVPDLLTSVIVTLQGHGDMAISSSIGSNIFDVTVGMPIPWLLYHAAYSGKPVPVESEPSTMAVQIGSLIGMLMLVVLSIRCCGWILNKSLGGVMLVLYVAFMCVSINQVLQEG